MGAYLSVCDFYAYLSDIFKLRITTIKALKFVECIDEGKLWGIIYFTSIIYFMKYWSVWCVLNFAVQSKNEVWVIVLNTRLVLLESHYRMFYRRFYIFWQPFNLLSWMHVFGRSSCSLPDAFAYFFLDASVQKLSVASSFAVRIQQYSEVICQIYWNFCKHASAAFSLLRRSLASIRTFFLIWP